MGEPLSGSGKALWGILLLIGLLSFPEKAHAVWGKAEEYDPVQWDDLKDFHEKVRAEESPVPMDAGNQIQDLTAQKDQAKTDEEKIMYERMIEQMKGQMLNLPKPDRFSAEAVGTTKFDTNQKRATPGNEKSETSMQLDATLRFNLSGRKTDLRFDVSGSKLWNTKFPINDMWKGELRLRYRRKYFRRLMHSSNWRIARTNTKTIEMNQSKIRWDGQIQNSMNYAFSRKLSLNLDYDYSPRYFPQEVFKKDNAVNKTFSPSAFWNFTPKTRISLGYSLGTNRSKTKSNNSNSNNVTAGYFGKVTRKSSASLNLAYTRQNQYKAQTTTNTYTVGVGYMWQATVKSQLALQAIRSMQSTVSVLDTGDDPNSSDAVSTRSTAWYINDSITLTLNTRLTRKITTNVTANFAMMSTKRDKAQQAEQDAVGENAETTQYNLPLTVSATYIVARWMTLNFSYAYFLRWGDKKDDNVHDHLLTVIARFIY